MGSAEGAFKSLFALTPPFSVILGTWDGYQNVRSVEFVKELSERIGLIEQDKGKYKDKSRNDVYQGSDDSRASSS